MNLSCDVFLKLLAVCKEGNNLELCSTGIAYYCGKVKDLYAKAASLKSCSILSIVHPVEIASLSYLCL